MRKTKIICTIGPATESYEMLEKLYHAGMNIVRLNMSHGDHEWHSNVIKRVKRLNKKVKYPIPILLDTQGPEIRTGHLASELNLKKGSVITISVRSSINVEESSFHIDYADLIHDVDVGSKITVDNGLINLEVLSKNEQIMECKVLDGGVLKSKRHVNLPGIRVNLPAITKKDKKDIKFGLEQDIDFIALSFVREAKDIRELKKMMGNKIDKTKVIAKIEDQEGVRNIEEIIQTVDGIMIARGDLGVEINIEELPEVQRRIQRFCQEEGKRVIVATHLLESMIENPIPTRAEVTDVANAIYEGADAIMLSGETTVGKYPTKCVKQMVRIAETTENSKDLEFYKNLQSSSDKQYLAIAATQLAENLDISGIVVITRRGITADLVTNCHPKPFIYAFTNVSKTRRTLVLNRGVYPFRITLSSDPEKTLQNAFRILREKEGFQPGDKIVVISDVVTTGQELTEGSEKIETIQIRIIPSV